jgi:hypothetical protein
MIDGVKHGDRNRALRERLEYSVGAHQEMFELDAGPFVRCLLVLKLRALDQQRRSISFDVYIGSDLQSHETQTHTVDDDPGAVPNFHDLLSHGERLLGVSDDLVNPDQLTPFV